MSEKTSSPHMPLPPVILANPRGFCAGVERAISIVETALEKFGVPIYVRHEVVHNKEVVDNLSARGVVFVENLAEVPRGSTVIFSAHGVSQTVREEAIRFGLKSFDATCPLVTKVHHQVRKMHSAGMEIVVIGHKDHPEVEGTMGQVNHGIFLAETPADVVNLTVRDPTKLAFVTQTTLSVDDAKQVITALQTRFPAIKSPKSDDICYATQNRQNAVKKLAQQCDLVLIVGSTNSSNATRLREVATRQGKQAYLIDNAQSIQAKWLRDGPRVGVSAGASTPEHLVQEVILALQDFGIEGVQELAGVEENMIFNLPKELLG